jgi:hypothetical protein
MEYWSTGVLEYWSTGVLERWSGGVKQSEKKSWECAKEGSGVDSPPRMFPH